jgi:hypothetical protein
MMKRILSCKAIIGIVLAGMLVILVDVCCRRAEAPRPPSADRRLTDSVRRETSQPPSSSFTPGTTATPRQTTTNGEREKLLQRKGELLMAQKQIRNSMDLTQTQKDSALRAIEEESIELSKKLLDAGR